VIYLVNPHRVVLSQEKCSTVGYPVHGRRWG